MTAIEPISKTAASAGPPVFSKLKVWILNETMASIVWTAVKSADTSQLRPVAPLQAGAAYYPMNLLAMMTYCYALGLLGSQEIESMVAEDSEFLKLCKNEYPTWKMLRRFRRHNRPILERCLSETFRAAWGFYAQPQAAGKLPETRLNKAAIGNIRLEDKPNAVSDWFEREARDRIEKAMWIDQMAMDDDE